MIPVFLRSASRGATVNEANGPQVAQLSAAARTKSGASGRRRADGLLIAEHGNGARDDLAGQNFERVVIVPRDANFPRIDRAGRVHAGRPVSDVIPTQKGHLEAVHVTKIAANGLRFDAIRPLMGHKKTFAAMIIDVKGPVFSETRGQIGDLKAHEETIIVANAPVLDPVRLRADQIVGLAETTSVARAPPFIVIQPRANPAGAQIARLIVANGAHLSSGRANLGHLDIVQEAIAAVKIGPADHVAGRVRAGPGFPDDPDRTLVPAPPAVAAGVLTAARVRNIREWSANHRKEG